MLKKGQITIFIIIGILLVAGIGTTVYIIKYKGSSDKGIETLFQSEFDREANSIKIQTDSCYENTAKEALTWIGEHGGYYNRPQFSENLGLSLLESMGFQSYHYYLGTFQSPSKSDVEEELSKYMDNELKYCLISIDKNNSTLIKEGNSSTKASISKGQVYFSTSWPITVKENNNSANINKFSTVQKSSLYEMIESSLYIDTLIAEDPQMLCLSCIDNFVSARGIYFDMQYNEDSTSLTLSQNDTESSPQIFTFLNKYK